MAIGTVDGTVVLRSISGATPTAGSPASSSPAGASRELAALQFTEPDNLKHYFEGNGKTDDFATRLWIAPDRHWLVTAGHYTTLWNLEQRRQHMVLMLNDGRGTSVNQPDPPVGLGGSPKFSGSSAGPLYHVLGWLFHQDGKSLTVSGGNGSQVHYDVVAGTHRLDGKDPKCEAIKLSPDGRLAAAWMVRYQPGSPPRTRWELLVLDGRDGTVRKSLGIFERQIKRPFKYNPFQTLAFSADSRRLAAVVFPSSTDSRELPPRLLLWDWESGKDYPTTAGCDNLSRLDLIEGGNALVTIKGTAVLGGETLVAEVYDVELGSRRYEVPLNRGHTGRIFALAFDLVNPLFVTADEHGMVLLRDLKTGDPRVRFKGHDAAITAVCFSSDGTQLATAAGDRTVKLWDVASLLNSK